MCILGDLIDKYMLLYNTQTPITFGVHWIETYVFVGFVFYNS